ncbi:unnamed protein product [Caenorhabditis angaria]|uniref:Delta-like protein n=1 Tax=Caenorhabditis angaria TaxID=860376 RepID=A0A9P1IV51_9PELO|nr:unnamed protein product [Caenorhabditis angaria]
MLCLFLLFAFFFQISNAHGSIEFIVTAQQNVSFLTEICSEVRCNNIDKNSRKQELIANFPYRSYGGKFKNYPTHNYDFHMIIFNANGDLIGRAFNKQEPDANWRTNTIETSDGFNVSYTFRTTCDKSYFGSKCEIFCKDSPLHHIKCSSNGQPGCIEGWTGKDCMTPLCANNCSGNGKCVAAGQCKCNNGFQGNDCSECVPSVGCVHGGCANNQSFTCQCLPGYIGPLCDKESNRCERETLCQNGAICLNENNSRGYRCECPAGFVGEFCQVPIDSVKCKHVRGRQPNMCLNGGTCFSFDQKLMECKCKPGFSGKFCEIGAAAPECSCQNGGTCSGQICQCPTCYIGDKCEIFDAVCLVDHFKNATIQHHSNTKTETLEVSNEVNIMAFILLLILLIVILGAIYVVLLKIRNRRMKPEIEIEVMATPKKSYKVCVIDPAQNQNCHHHDNCEPPPAYSPQKYKSLPTREDSFILHPSPPIIV